MWQLEPSFETMATFACFVEACVFLSDFHTLHLQRNLACIQRLILFLALDATKTS